MKTDDSASPTSVAVLVAPGVSPALVVHEGVSDGQGVVRGCVLVSDYGIRSVTKYSSKMSTSCSPPFPSWMTVSVLSGVLVSDCIIPRNSSPYSPAVAAAYYVALCVPVQIT